MTSEAFRGGSLIHLQTTQSRVIANVDGGRGFPVPDFCTSFPVNQLQQAGLFIPGQWETRLGTFRPLHILSLSLHRFLQDFPETSQPQPVGLGNFCPFRLAVCWGVHGVSL